MNKTAIIIVGPTASGKTSYALQLAKQYNTEIISADSRQCFRELNIGVAKPSPQELSEVKHHFINSHSIYDTVTAATFESYALDVSEQIFARHDTLIMAGGTGLYIKAFCEGLDQMPEIPVHIRETITALYQEKGLEWLQQEIISKDPHYAETGEMQNPQRLMRALEVFLASGVSIRKWQQKNLQQRYFSIKKIGLDIPRDMLYKNINERVDCMMREGLLEEVRALVPFRHLNALQTVGYSELFDHLDGKMTLGEAVEKIKINTRQYARRQMTWFKKDETIEWKKLKT